MDIYVSQLVLFSLLFARITSAVVVAPVFGHQAVPVQVKVGLGLFLALVMFPLISAESPMVVTELLPLVLLMIREVFVGLILGYSVTILFSGVRYAGELISFEMGISMSSAFDPDINQQTATLGEFLYVVTLLIFLLLNGHHFVIESLQLSYFTVPIGEFVLTGTVASVLIDLVGTIFVIAVKFAAPMMVAMFLSNIALSILSKVMPQMNIFMLGFPMKIGLGILVLMTGAPFTIFVFKKLLASFENNILELVKVL